MNIKIGIINISDRASRGIYEDIPGKAIAETLNEYLTLCMGKSVCRDPR